MEILPELLPEIYSVTVDTENISRKTLLKKYEIEVFVIDLPIRRSTRLKGAYDSSLQGEN